MKADKNAKKQGRTDIREIFEELKLKENIEKMSDEEILKRLIQIEPSTYSAEDLDIYDKAELGEKLLQEEIYIQSDKDLRVSIDNMSIEDVKERLSTRYHITESRLQDLSEREIRESLFDEEKITGGHGLLSEQRAAISKKKFEEYLSNLDGMPEEIKKQMLSNLDRELKSVEMKNTPIGLKGYYEANEKKLVIDTFGNDVMTSTIDESYLIDTWTHEMVHAATCNDKEKRVGLQTYGDSARGVALNEGMTEYLSNKVLEANGEKKYEMYPMFIPVIENLVDLYGEQEIINAFVNSPERLEELMKKDGKSLSEFIELTDDCYREIYSGKYRSLTEAMYQEENQERWQNVGEFIEDIKAKRLKEDPQYMFKESNWKKSKWRNAFEATIASEKEYKQKNDNLRTQSTQTEKEENEVEENSEQLDNLNVTKSQILPIASKKPNRVVAWFKNLKDKITGRFKKEDETLMLGAGNVSEYPLKNEEEPSYSLQEERKEFLEEIRVEESELLTPSKTKEESKQRDTTKDYEQMEL